MTDDPTTKSDPTSGRSSVLIRSVVLVLVVACIAFVASRSGKDDDVNRKAKNGQSERDTALKPGAEKDGAVLVRHLDMGQMTLQWEPVAANQHLVATAATESNIHPDAYVGPKSCQSCHKENYQHWLGHAHRKMNLPATDENVVGDFGDGAHIKYKGGLGTFFKDEGEFRMRLERDGVRRDYVINQTIGSRFDQRYVGLLLEGPEPEGHLAYTEDHVLPFGYSILDKRWTPIVHVDNEEYPDEKRRDPFASPEELDESFSLFLYAERCNYCHNTFPLGDSFIRYPLVKTGTAPQRIVMGMSDYIADVHPGVWDGTVPAADVPTSEMSRIVRDMVNFEADEKAAARGISCESCHLGCREHAEGRRKKPSLFPLSPHVYVPEGDPVETGRTQQNTNWACARCHTGMRSQLAAGMATWNSTEYSDAMKGACYSQLKCIDCHNPHKGIGREWTRSPAQDDAVCMRCHEEFKDKDTLVQHTHHDADSTGSSCMNCHMPKINEGLHDLVRTHMIFSPTNADMIEEAHPNACNLCHLEKPIDWTLTHLKDWYGAEYSQARIEETHPNRNAPVARTWIQHSYKPVRLIAAETLSKAKADWALADVINVLDDEFLLNRQFAQRAVERMLNIKLADFGYVFYMMHDERIGPIEKLRERFLSEPVTAVE